MSDALSLAPQFREKRAAVAPPAPAPAGARPIVYDMSHLVARLRAHTGTGIDRIDLAFASHFFATPDRCEAVRYGSSGPPRRIASAWALEFTRAAQDVWTNAEASRAGALRAWLDSSPGE